MNKLLKIRNLIAEQGTEKTLDETIPILKKLDKLTKSITIDQYLSYKNMTKTDLVNMAIDLKMPFREIVQIRQIVLKLYE